MATGTTLFPNAVDSHAGGVPLGFAEIPVLRQTALDGPISAAATTIVVLSTTGFPSLGYAAVGTGNADTEIFGYSGKTATSFTGVTRAMQGTTARAFASGATVAGVVTPETINAHSAAIEAVEQVMGAGISQVYGVMRKIAETSLAAPAATIDFTSIPQVYRHLRLALSSANNTGTTTVHAQLAAVAAGFDSGANYDRQYGSANASSAAATEGLGQTSLLLGVHGAAANVMDPVAIDFLDYRSAYHKAMVGLSANKVGTSTGNLLAFFLSGYWRNTGAIGAIRLFPAANSFAIGTRATLWGVPA